MVLVRAAALPLPPDDAPEGRSRSSDGAPYDEDRLRRRIAELAADPRLMEAVGLASAGLAAEVDRAVAGERLRLKSLRRIALSLTKYHSRMSHRPTPFGLFAGVGFAGFGSVPAREPIGGGHRVTRPDAAWLDGVLETLLDVPAVLERSLLTANNLHVVRDGRLVLVDDHDRDGERQLAGSVRHTRVVRQLLAAAAHPTPHPRLVEAARREFPHAPPGAIEGSIRQLVRGHFLLGDLTPPPDLRLEHLAVCADTDGLRLVDTVTGRRVRPLSYSMLNPSGRHLPYVARFLLEIGQEGRSFCAPWSWGGWAAAPALPRVRHGRSVLSPARWLPDRALRAAADRGDAEWSGQVGRWRRRWDVPRRVLLTKADHRVAVDLDDPLHLLVFRDEVRRAPGLTVVERYAGPAERQWFRGPEGAHAAEFFFPVFARPTGPGPARGTRPAGPVAAPVPPLPGDAATGRGARAHLPGGAWLYAKIHVPQARQAEVLARHLGPLTDPGLLRRAGVDLWFFVRYEDPAPHIRLRFHGTPESLWPVLLPELHAWARAREEAGVLGKVVLDTYEPEVERYGGPAALPHAERFFHADSEAVVALLAGSAARPDDPTSAAAPGILDIVTRLGSPDEALGWLSSPVVLARRGDVPRERKQAVAALLDSRARPRPPAPADGGDAGWSARAAALSGLREVLSADAPDPGRWARIALSLAHMHVNRLLGPRPEQELTAQVTAREALALWLGRKRNTG
ncbi:lantibiotic dehydratase [Streptomyces sp. 769]|uniref:lantibiotic dehydratase n=1 Tax=Streptomyces sp. 769 TaxID=1262452 RepID=UPI00057E4700|nr:lantibiotic dehydratase [Streptomyces sp. 769]